MIKQRRLGSQTLVLLTAMALATVPACSPTQTELVPAAAAPETALSIPTIAPEVRDQRGTIVNSVEDLEITEPLAGVGATRYNVVFRSVSGIDGTLRDVSGAVFLPPGPPPVGGWPLIAYGHGTTGLSTECGPSGYPNLLGYDNVVASLVALGFVVSLPDYEGLGQPGVHPFLEPRTAAFNMIDAVRAARNLIPESSSKWFALGVSQGGQASWAANEMAGVYGDGLQFLGSSSQSPFADLSGLAELSSGGWLTRAQQALLPLVVEGMNRTHPDVHPGDYLHGGLAENRDLFMACTSPAIEESHTVALGVTDSKPVSQVATDKLRKALANYALPQLRASGPMLVITGGADEVVRPQWVTSAVTRACELGDTIEFTVRPGENQANLDAGPRVAAWLQERLAGAPPVDTCDS